MLVQHLTAHIPLLMATSAFGLGEDASVLNEVTYTIYVRLKIGH